MEAPSKVKTARLLRWVCPSREVQSWGIFICFGGGGGVWCNEWYWKASDLWVLFLLFKWVFLLEYYRFSALYTNKKALSIPRQLYKISFYAERAEYCLTHLLYLYIAGYPYPVIPRLGTAIENTNRIQLSMPSTIIRLYRHDLHEEGVVGKCRPTGQGKSQSEKAGQVAGPINVASVGKWHRQLAASRRRESSYWPTDSHGRLSPPPHTSTHPLPLLPLPR